MSYQEERLQEIANAIREVKGTTEKIPATSFASEIVGLSVVKPSGIITIKENGSHNVANYEWAEVSVEAGLREKDIIGTWLAESGFNLVLDKNGIGSYGNIPIIYSIVNNQIVVYIEGVEEPEYLVYNEDADTISAYGDDTTVLTRVQETANLITKEITENGTYKASDDGADGYSEVVVNVSGGGGKPSPFADATPEEIQQIGNEISAKGMTSAEVEETYGWKIGDTKDITLTTGEVIQVRIIGFNHDNLTGGGKAGITLDMVNCLNTNYMMNSSKTNAGGWASSRLRNTTLPTIKATLPTEWQEIIVKVDKKSANGGGTNFTAIETTSDDLFLLSVFELIGIKSYAQAEEGLQYEYWATKTAKTDKIKKQDTNNDGIADTAVVWWLRSSFTENIQSFCRVVAEGDIGGRYASSEHGVSFAFCVGSSPAPVIAGLPIEATTDQDMTNALVEDNLGKVYKFTGTSDTYDNNAIYIIEEI